MGGYRTMEMAGGNIDIYVERPLKKHGPVVVVLHEIFGVNTDMRDTCRELAAQGFTALCPDLFWRIERGTNLDAESEAAWKKGLSLYESYDVMQGVRDIAAVVKLARDYAGIHGKVGLAGYCLGGLLAFLGAVHLDVDASVSYYGGGIQNYLREVKGHNAPMLVHLGIEDEYIPPSAQETISSALAPVPGATVHFYEGSGHAFTRHTGGCFDATSAALANFRTSKFFHTWLVQS